MYSAGGCGRIMVGDRTQVKTAKRDNFNGQNDLTPPEGGPTMEGFPSEHVGAYLYSYGGDLASTGVKNRGMHAELH